ncbi:hypothetical protein Zmor_012987 [Zophobas morio]|uniref:Uncharacterized protein n=1 Tax=Zophobas morio TaxID=2755281 RepID=A0AA38MF28_9CUCU|nr:hypothetical protein Zmor_012987 [Zophobas morio]
MRRFPLPPPAMWPCERPIVHVLNGDYPAAELRRMSVPGLERLVAKLVQRTAKPAARPQWWPRGLHYTQPLDLGLSSEREIKLAFKQLIVSCCQFFKANERRRPNAKHRFLAHLRLHPRGDVPNVAAPPPPPAPAKLATCVHIPFSSDVGRAMAAREQHGMSDELRMRRLERSEWYTNKGVPRAADADYEVAATRPPGHHHVYKMPRRQQYQRRRSLHDVDFLAGFCTPVRVVVERLDLSKFAKGDKSEDGDKRRELVVRIRDTEKMCCDLRRSVSVKLVRTSPRLRDV